MKKLLMAAIASCSLSMSVLADDLTELVTMTAKVNTYQAKFEQTITDSAGLIKESAKGEFWLKKPQQFIWKTQSPYEQEVISNGETLWIHDIDLDQVNIQSLNKALGTTPALLLSASAETLGASFIVKKLVSGSEQSATFELLPKDSEGVFERLLLLFKDDVLREIALYDSLGQQTIVRLKDVKANLELDDKQFVFVIPEDLDVVDSRAQADGE
ncbi:outer membrane lipoprotein chaperone LolA [Pleionea sp. CnH1-48]|uniref:outer membrane lipoprotein chaperone LolA n=1 Tax=Pleionea sp. CnH1-48 TaxID=2954494 RepID=UPI002097D992|nr:outer membrane lipoprotein chaperone LolA [Pleionea sp. CnH1-48]MCO7222756.1 outer membrane lipoprotein chaperone LolA [Pleionea sp. CnH1-48]